MAIDIEKTLYILLRLLLSKLCLKNWPHQTNHLEGIRICREPSFRVKVKVTGCTKHFLVLFLATFVHFSIYFQNIYTYRGLKSQFHWRCGRDIGVADGT